MYQKVYKHKTQQTKGHPNRKQTNLTLKLKEARTMVHPTQTETRLDSPATCRNHCDTEDTCRSFPSPSPLGTTRRNPPDVHRNRRIWTTINETTPVSTKLHHLPRLIQRLGRASSDNRDLISRLQATKPPTNRLISSTGPCGPYNAMQTRSKAEPHRSTKSPEIKTSTINPLWPTYNMRHQYQIERQSIGWSTNS